jgi:Flp pilus assembly pilin Flp
MNLKKFFLDEEGSSGAGYALCAALLAIVIVVMIGTLGPGNH